jgi:hypothetical protein
VNSWVRDFAAREKPYFALDITTEGDEVVWDAAVTDTTRVYVSPWLRWSC